MEKIKTKYLNLSIIDLQNFLFWFVLVCFLLVSISKNEHFFTSLSVFFILLLLQIFIVIYRRKSKSNIKLKYSQSYILLLSILFFFAIFESISLVLPNFISNNYDTLMLKSDFLIFGLNPTIWLEKFNNKLLTEIMYVLYIFYFFLPIIAMYLFFSKKEFENTEKAIFLLQFCFYISYITYFFVPVTGPRYFISNLHTTNLQGYILAEPIRNLINFLETNKYDCFPSLHAAILLLCMYLFYKAKRIFFYFMIPVAVGILFSLVYLRYHYVTDVIAGLFYTIFSIFVTNYIFKNHKKYFINHL